VNGTVGSIHDPKEPCRAGCGLKRKAPPPQLLLAQDQEIQPLRARFQATAPNGVDVQQWEVLVRTAIFKPAHGWVEYLLQGRPTASVRPASPSRGRRIRAGKPSRCRASWAPLSSAGITTITSAKDCYPALEHAGQVLAALIGKDHPDDKTRQRRWAKRLLKDKVPRLIEETRQAGAGKAQEPAVQKALGYFVRNVHRRQ